MPSISHRLASWLFDVPLRSRLLYKAAKAYCRIYTNGRRDSFDIQANGELRLLQRVAPGLQVAFDVGANVGDWTSEILQLKPDLVVHAFEPVEGTRRKFIECGFPDSVWINPFGLSDERDSLTIYSYGDGSGLSSLHRRTDLEEKNHALHADPLTIELGVLDDYCTENGIDRIDFLKIDVEGHEASVLAGAQRMLAEGRIGIIQIEYGTAFKLSNTLLRDIFELVASAGMSGGMIAPDGVEREDGYHARMEDFRLSNWVFAKPDHPTAWG